MAKKIMTDMTPEKQLEKLSSSLGKLAPKGTWICEVLENIWRSESQEEADKIAIEARNTFAKIGIENALWCGDR
jgi:hypothetical protein